MVKGVKSKTQQSTYSGMKKKDKVFVYLQGSPYHDAEGSLYLRSFLFHAVNNASPIVGNKIDKNELYIQFPTRTVNYNNIKQLEKA